MKAVSEKFSYERLANTRRIRKVRRLFKQVPLFAYALMLAELPGYTYARFLTDLKPSKPKVKKKPSKSSLTRYGRYDKMNMLIQQYQQTKDISFALQAMKLKKLMTKPYRIIVKKNGYAMEFNLSPLIPFSSVENLVKLLSSTKSLKEAEEHYLKFTKYAHIL